MGTRSTLVLVGLFVVAALCGAGTLAHRVLHGVDRTVVADGVRTDADGRGLTASYSGGACDGPARLQVDESRDVVRLSVRVGPDTQDSCDAIALPRTVSARLLVPLGDRALLMDGVPVAPFDGAQLLEPAPRPGAVLAGESGGGPDTGVPVAQRTQSRTTTWSRTFGAARPPYPVPRRCDGPPDIGISQGGGPRGEGSQARRLGTRDVGSARADLVAYPGGLTLTWTTAGGGVVSVGSFPSCPGEAVLTEAELLAFARGLS